MKIKVLIIEDDPGIVESISLAFRLYWPETRIISTHLGREGIELVKAKASDAVILDLGLPDMSGFEVLKQIRLFSSIPIIVLTVRSQEDDIVRALEGEANDYVVKPFKQRELLARVQSHVSQWMANEVKAHILWTAPL